ncbi:MAG: carboxypeptidase regulatory-like domain-containing protein [Elusimicrobiota bacterium]
MIPQVPAYFTIGTTGGDPASEKDNDKKVLYGFPSPGTSWTVVRIDGTDSTTFGAGGTWSISPAKTGSKLVAEHTYGDISVYQELTIVEGYSTGRNDTCQILYKITNSGAVSHDAGVMVMLDTMLGNNDGAPFYALDAGEITTDTRWTSSLPQSCQVFDSLSDPTITGLIEFTGTGFNDPDKVILGYWPAVGSTWNYPFDATRSFLDNDGGGVISGTSPDSDSAVLVYMGTSTYTAGSSKTYAVRIGLGEMRKLNWGPFVLGISAPGKFKFNDFLYDFYYTPSDFRIVAYVHNKSASAVSNAQLKLNIHDNLRLKQGETAVKYIEKDAGSRSIPPDCIAVIDWAIECTGRVVGENFYAITISCSNVDQGPGTIPARVDVEGAGGAVFGIVTDSSGNPVSGADIEVYRDGVFKQSCSASSYGTYYIGGLISGEYEVRVSAPGYGTYSFYHAVTVEAAGSSSANAVLRSGQPGAAGALNIFFYPNPVKLEKNINIRFNTDGPGEVKIRIFNSAGRLIDDISYDISGAGEHYVPWNIENCVNGVYFCQVRFGSNIETSKFAVLKYKQ